MASNKSFPLNSLEIAQRYVSEMEDSPSPRKMMDDIPEFSPLPAEMEKSNPNSYKKKAHRYVPTVNPESTRLSEGERGRGKDRWKYLYKDDLKKPERRLRQMEKAKKDSEDAELAPCTFKPDMEYTNNYLKQTNQQEETEDVVERTEKWSMAKNKKIMFEKEQKEKEEFEECSFKPKISKKPQQSEEVELTTSSVKAIEKHLERMYGTRFDKESIELSNNKKPGSGKNWKYKITVPEAPNLSFSKKKNLD